MDKVKDEHYNNFKRELFVHLQRLIECPGCSGIHQSIESCAQHLLEVCLRIKKKNSDDCRAKLIKWVLDLGRKRTCLDRNRNHTGAYKRNVIMNDAAIDPSQNVRMAVNLPGLPVNMRCPICDKFFSSEKACADHVFGDCLYFKSFKFERKAIGAQTWFTQVFMNNNVNYSTFINEMNEKWPTILCKYCNEKFSSDDNLMKHFHSNHSNSSNLEEAVCLVCNYSAQYDEMLGKHVIAKHLKCGCGLSKFKDFYSLKFHVKSCKENKEDFIRCPICYTLVSLDSENTLIDHFAKCRPVFETLNFDNSSLFSNCDVCFSPVLISNVDCHLRTHVVRRDTPQCRQKRVRLSLDKIKNYVNPLEFNELEELFVKKIKVF